MTAPGRMTGPRIGSLFSGYGGLDMAVQATLGGTLAWVSDIEPGPTKILAHHHPDVPNLGDITAADFTQVEQVDIICGGFPCFAAGTPILTRRGSVSIEDVVIGDEVWTHRNRWRPVVDVMSRTSELVRLGPITTTPDHPFYSRHHRRVWNNDIRQYRTHLGEPEWTPAVDAQGCYLASPLAVTDKEPVTWVCDPWLAGRYVADGWTNRKQVMIAVGEGKQEEFERETSVHHWTKSISGPSCTRYTLSSMSIAAWLKENFGHGADGKTIPTFILAAAEDDRQRFLAGYLSGDGSEKPDGHWVANTVSTHLASQLRLLALSLGYTSQVREVATPDTAVIEGRVVNQRNYWSVVIRPNVHRYTFDIEGLHWFCQRKPVVPSGTGTVYDLTVDEDHSFVAWGYVVHNCQDVSHAGRRAGLIRDGEGRTRSGLWGHMLRAIDEQRPRMVVAENVRGLLSAQADSDVELCPFCMGDDGASPMRALGAVLADLADIGYDAAWCGLRAADVGAPHGRFRMFILAWPADAEGDARRVAHGNGEGVADTDGPGLQGPYDPPRTTPTQRHGHALAGAGRPDLNLFRTPNARDGEPRGTQHPAKRLAGGHQPSLADQVEHLLPTPAVNDMGAGKTVDAWDAWTDRMKAAHGNGNGHGASLSIEALRMLPTPRATDGTKGGPNQRGSSGDLMLPSAVQLMPTPSVADVEGGRKTRSGARNDELLLNGLAAEQRFGAYAPAIARWEHVLDRPAPAPTEPTGKAGAHRLSPAFVEFLMGLPAGHVTDVPGLSRNAQMKTLGNGVVPAQAAAALRHLLFVRDSALEAA